MAGEIIRSLSPTDLYRETAVGYNPWSFSVPVDDICAVRLNKMDLGGYNARCHIPAGLLATGLTFKFALTDGGEYVSDLGKVVRIGITVKRLISGESADIDTGAGTEQFVNVTLQATTKLWTVATLAIANANLDSAAAADAVIFRIRRAGSNAADTCQGSVLLDPIAVLNT